VKTPVIPKRGLTRVRRRAWEEEVAQELFRIIDEHPVMWLLAQPRNKVYAQSYRHFAQVAAEMIEEAGRDWIEHPDVREYAIAILRGAASHGPRPVAKRGGRPVLDPLNVKFAFGALTDHGVSKSRAFDLIATRCNVSIESVKKAIAKSAGY
jgi:hypothetical protein